MDGELLDTNSRLIAAQRAYYDERAEDYMDASKGSDRRVPGTIPPELVTEIIDELRPTGDVLELACGNGRNGFTEHIARYARSITAVDGSRRMLDIIERTITDPKVTFVHSDIFEWTPDRTYDVVFFGFWLSHVPPGAFDAFWGVVRRALEPTGRVAFVDEDDRGAGNDDVRPVAGTPVARRTLADGRSFDIVKVFWNPGELESRLRSSGWDIAVERRGRHFLYGAGRA